MSVFDKRPPVVSAVATAAVEAARVLSLAPYEEWHKSDTAASRGDALLLALSALSTEIEKAAEGADKDRARTHIIAAAELVHYALEVCERSFDESLAAWRLVGDEILRARIFGNRALAA